MWFSKEFASCGAKSVLVAMLQLHHSHHIDDLLATPWPEISFRAAYSLRGGHVVACVGKTSDLFEGEKYLCKLK